MSSPPTGPQSRCKAAEKAGPSMAPFPHTLMLEALQVGFVSGGLRVRVLQGQGSAGAGPRCWASYLQPHEHLPLPSQALGSSTCGHTVQSALPSANSHVSHRQQTTTAHPRGLGPPGSNSSFGTAGWMTSLKP